MQIDWKKMGSIALYVLVPVAIIALAVNVIYSGQNKGLTYREVVQLFEENRVGYLEYDSTNGSLRYWWRDQCDPPKKGELQRPKESQKDNPQKYMVPPLHIVDFKNRVIFGLVEKNNVGKAEPKINVDFPHKNGNSWILSMIPTVLMGALVVGVLILMMRRMNNSITSENNRNMSFGKAKLRLQDKNEKDKNTFADVAGADEEKEELAEIVEFLKDPKRFNDLGARIPKGVLLVGPPGTGKTLLARAVAGEAEVPFFSISGSDFVELYVGVGASRVRDMFAQAKKHAPAIVFIDEIDAVGRQRGAGMGGGHDEREQTLNQLLVEMDGFGNNEGVIIVAATNRPDILDPALLRPGRFDRRVTVLVPDVRGREQILKVHAKNKPLAPDVELKVIAQTTAGFTGADLENLLNEAALLAARNEKKAITRHEIENAMLKVVVGTEKKSHQKTAQALRLTAYHEAGHAVASHALQSQDAVHQISIISRGMAGGFTMYLPTEDKDFVSKREMQESIIALLGGRVAESLWMDDVSTGASNDIERATKLARDMVTRYGMSDLGAVAYTSGHDEVFLGRDYGHTRNYSESMAARIDDEVKRMIDQGYAQCQSILEQNHARLERVVAALLERETISGAEFQAIMQA